MPRRAILVLVLCVCATVARAHRICLGVSDTCSVEEDGSVLCWGSNTYGRLGDGTLENKVKPNPVSEIDSATSVACGTIHSCASLMDGTVKCWGYNGSKQLGLGTDTLDKLVPTAVPGLSDVTSVSAGEYHSCALLKDGTIKCWGYNRNGQIGVGSSENSISTPTAVSGITTATSLGVGMSHTCAVLLSGGVLCWGKNDNGQLGDGTTTNRLTSTPVSGINSATSVGAGNFHTCAPFCRAVE